MKPYEIRFDPDAENEALDAAQYIARRHPMNAEKWYSGLEKAINSLKIMPQRSAKARESDFVGEDLHQYIYKSHRIIFRIEEDARVVRILHIRHASQRAIGESETEDQD